MQGNYVCLYAPKIWTTRYASSAPILNRFYIYKCNAFIMHQMFIFIYICFCLCLYTVLGTGPVKFESLNDGSNTPFRSGFIDSFVAWPFNLKNNYRLRIMSYFKPSQTGQHRFFANYDDIIELYLSENNKEARKLKIMEGSGTNFNLVSP